MHGIEVRESGAGAIVALWGEFDVSSLDELRQALNGVSTLRGPALVDLSGITFLDLQSTRELAVRSLLYAHQLIFHNPSPEVIMSASALGLEDCFRNRPDTDLNEPPIFSEVS